MGESISLPVRMKKSIPVVKIPQAIFGTRIVLQAHQISDPKRAKDLLDSHNVAQVFIKGDIKFFSRTVDISDFS